MVPAEKKSKLLSLVNHTTETIHHHHVDRKEQQDGEIMDLWKGELEKPTSNY